MAVEFDPNEFRRQNFGSVPPQPQATPAPQIPAPMPAPMPPQAAPVPAQGHPQPYAPPQQAPAHYQPQPHHQPSGHPAQYIPGQPQPAPQAEYAASPHAYGQNPNSYFDSPADPAPVSPEKTSLLSRFKRGTKEAKPLKPPKASPRARSNSGFAKPFLAGLLSGVVMTIVGVSVLGSMAKKSMNNKMAAVAMAIEQPVEIQSEVTEIAEHDRIIPEE